MSGPFVIKWSGKEYTFVGTEEEDVASLKRRLQADTQVLPKRQKILGLKTRAGKPAADDDLLSNLLLKAGQKFMMMGKPEEDIQATDKAADDAPQVQGDFDLDEESLQQIIDLKDRPENQEKLARRVQHAEQDIVVLNEPRPGKKCLVLDIDYTLFDLNSVAERPDQLARPYLHHMLAAVYPHYDIVIWSATSMKWIEVKMRELRVSNHPDFKITCFMDSNSMLSVCDKKGKVFKCKPLPVLWGRFPQQYSKDNTIMFDDLRRNYVFNRQNGLVIRPFKRAHFTRDTDSELLHLTEYLLIIAELPSLKHLHHSRWESYMAKHTGQ